MAGPGLVTPIAFKQGFSAQISGSVRQRLVPGGALVDLALRLSGRVRGKLRIRLAGTPMGGGGLSMTGSQVALTAPGLRSPMEGRVLSLQGEQFVARVRNGSEPTLDLRGSLSIDQQTQDVSGTLVASPAVADSGAAGTGVAPIGGGQ
jgi:hypothetical protein